MVKKPIAIAGQFFPTTSEAKKYLSASLNLEEPDAKITDHELGAVLQELFYSRPKKIQELRGREIVGWTREKGTSTTCFAAILDTGEILHFSFIKSLDALSAGSETEGPNGAL